MLDTFMTNSYSFDSYTTMNDNLLYLDYLDENYERSYINTTPDMAYKYQGNLFGLFSEMKIKPELYIYTMYINGYRSPNEFKGDKVSFIRPIKPPIPTT